MKRILFILLLVCVTPAAYSADKKIVFLAGTPSHGPGEHEYRAGCLLLQKCLEGVPGIQTVVYSNEWPQNPDAFEGADAIVISMNGGGHSVLLQGDHLQQLGALMDKGVGLAAIHWGIEMTKEKGENEYLNWLGGAFETNWSINPVWKAHFDTLPDHPITRGVAPFVIQDEWYFHLRFPDGMKGVTPILWAVPPLGSIARRDGPYSGNPDATASVKNGEVAIVVWAFERPNGGRGFGFGGAHYHKNYGDDNFRKIMLNGLLWIAKADVPLNGVESKVTDQDLQANLDPKVRRH